MRSKLLAIALFAAVSLSGCNQAEPQGSLAEAQESLAELQSQLLRMEERVVTLEDLVMDLRGEAFRESLRRGDPLSLDPTGGQGFSVHMSQYGTLTYRVTGVSSVGDGSRVTMEVGNLTSAIITGGKMKASYGVRRSTGGGADDSELQESLREYLEWHESLRETEVSFTTTLSPGQWNTISITLPGIVPERLGYLRLDEMEFPRISLRR